MIHHQVWYWLEEINDLVIPGPGQLIGFDVKRDFISPVDFIPFVGPIGKLHKLTKLVKHGRKLKPLMKKYAFWGLNLIGDVYAAKESVEWFNNRYRSFAADIESESSSVARRGNAVGPGGGTKKKPSSSRSTRKAKKAKPSAHYLPKAKSWLTFEERCRARQRRGRQCVRALGHSGRHQYK